MRKIKHDDKTVISLYRTGTLNTKNNEETFGNIYQFFFLFSWPPRGSSNHAAGIKQDTHPCLLGTAPMHIDTVIALIFDAPFTLMRVLESHERKRSNYSDYSDYHYHYCFS